MSEVTLLHGDCLELMPTIPAGSVDLILCDLPYGTTACAWDSVIPFEPLWAEYKRVIKPRGAVVLFGSQPFTSALIASNMAMFKYCWVWEKDCASGFLHAKNKPLKAHEDIAVFSWATTGHTSQSDNRMVYLPQMGRGVPYKVTNITVNTGPINTAPSKANIDYVGTPKINDGQRYPRSVMRFSEPRHKRLHPTQKPVALLEYLIRTYTNEGERVLDNCMGSGSAGVAAVNTARHFIGIEKDFDYFTGAQSRIEAAQAQGVLVL